MTTPDILFIVAALINVVGLIGSLVPVVPGPPLSFIALVLCCIANPHPIFITLTVLMFIFIVFVTLVDYLAPGWVTNKVGGCRKAVWGANIGVVIGLFYMPFGLVIGPFAGAFCGEMIETRQWWHSLQVAAYSLLSLVISTFFKVLSCLLVLGLCIVIAFFYYS